MQFKQGRALVIGIANYEEVRRLPEAVLNDARDTADTLRSSSYCGYPEANVTVLTDGQATLEGIRKALADLAADATADDTVAIFFSGHGTRVGLGRAATSALVPYDCKRGDLAGTSLGEVELSAAISAIKASRVVVSIDACHAAGAATLKSDLEGDHDDGLDEGFDEKSLQQLASGTGRVVFASSRATETSLVRKRERNSVFTTALLAGLKGAAVAADDGTIRVFDLFNYVSEAVRQAAPGRQHPIFKASNLEENFPVALVLGGTKTIAPKANCRERQLEQIMSDLFPAGPTDQQIWLRAGGEVANLALGGTGRAQWFSALRLLSQGGGGGSVTRESLIDAALEEFPAHRELGALR
ncbi:peptidase C14 caspase catalytic subunit p20 [Xanthobacter versatilis]|uniref:Peptidase C14 caspase catalytic subunit p20 n=1 Tax=Xanthobacter autotrophicus (strain ATCC BAA-1158 / Py2) TaxID=78245 RepID=A7IBU5_XANP2|nr:peptidase C14 caspase catalytic subunit p20 [Xanthobacter autotrophicus Py2]